MSEAFLAEVRIFPFNFAPSGWAMCSGSVLPIQQNTALFSLLGTNYGGNGTTNFALPNLQGSFPLGQSMFTPPPGLSERSVGETGGASAVALAIPNLPGHSHQLLGEASLAAVQSPANAALGVSPAKPYHPGPADTFLAGMEVAGQGLPHNNMPPYLVLNFCIAVAGIYPSRQ